MNMKMEKWIIKVHLPKLRYAVVMEVEEKFFLMSSATFHASHGTYSLSIAPGFPVVTDWRKVVEDDRV